MMITEKLIREISQEMIIRLKDRRGRYSGIDFTNLPEHVIAKLGPEDRWDAFYGEPLYRAFREAADEIVDEHERTEAA
jgi:hypothetical protein